MLDHPLIKFFKKLRVSCYEVVCSMSKMYVEFSPGLKTLFIFSTSTLFLYSISTGCCKALKTLLQPCLHKVTLHGITCFKEGVAIW